MGRWFRRVLSTKRAQGNWIPFAQVVLRQLLHLILSNPPVKWVVSLAPSGALWVYRDDGGGGPRFGVPFPAKHFPRANAAAERRAVEFYRHTALVDVTNCLRALLDTTELETVRPKLDSRRLSILRDVQNWLPSSLPELAKDLGKAGGEPIDYLLPSPEADLLRRRISQSTAAALPPPPSVEQIAAQELANVRETNALSAQETQEQNLQIFEMNESWQSLMTQLFETAAYPTYMRFLQFETMVSAIDVLLNLETDDVPPILRAGGRMFMLFDFLHALALASASKKDGGGTVPLVYKAFALQIVACCLGVPNSEQWMMTNTYPAKAGADAEAEAKVNRSSYDLNDGVMLIGHAIGTHQNTLEQFILSKKTAAFVATQPLAALGERTTITIQSIPPQTFVGDFKLLAQAHEWLCRTYTTSNVANVAQILQKLATQIQLLRTRESITDDHALMTHTPRILNDPARKAYTELYGGGRAKLEREPLLAMLHDAAPTTQPPVRNETTDMVMLVLGPTGINQMFQKKPSLAAELTSVIHTREKAISVRETAIFAREKARTDTERVVTDPQVGVAAISAHDKQEAAHAQLTAMVKQAEDQQLPGITHKTFLSLDSHMRAALDKLKLVYLWRYGGVFFSNREPTDSSPPYVTQLIRLQQRMFYDTLRLRGKTATHAKDILDTVYARGRSIVHMWLALAAKNFGVLVSNQNFADITLESFEYATVLTPILPETLYLPSVHISTFASIDRDAIRQLCRRKVEPLEPLSTFIECSIPQLLGQYVNFPTKGHVVMRQRAIIDCPMLNLTLTEAETALLRAAE